MPDQTTMPDIAALPTLEDTQAALAQISPHRNPEAAKALRLLSEAIVKVVSDLDRSSNISLYLSQLTLICKGPNNFQLQISDQNSLVNREFLEREIADTMRSRVDGYGKQQRPVVLEFSGDNHGRG